MKFLRIIYFACISYIFLLCVSASVEAFSASQIITGDRANQVRNTLEWAHWNPQGGKNDGKHIYVIYAPLCERCIKLFKEIGTIAANIEIRWILANHQPVGAGFLHTAPIQQAYHDFIKGKRGDDTQLEAFAYQYNKANKHFADVSFSMTPLIAFSTADGMRLIETNDVKVVARELKAIIPVANRGALALPYLEKISTSTLGKPQKHSNKTKKPQNLYLLPDEKSPMHKHIKLSPGQYYDTSWPYDEKWIRVHVFNEDDAWKVFILKPDCSLEFE